MTFGGALFLIAVGAIIRYAMHFHIAGLNEHALGLILMIVGFVGLILAAVQLMFVTARTRRAARDPYYGRDPYTRPTTRY